MDLDVQSGYEIEFDKFSFRVGTSLLNGNGNPLHSHLPFVMTSRTL